VIPVGLLLALAVARFLPAGEADRLELFQTLFDRASQAYADGRFGAAAEYAEHALDQEGTADERAGAHCLRGESLLREGHFAEAQSSFEAVLADPGAGAYSAQAWSGLTRAREAAGDLTGAAQARETLTSEYPDTPWAQAAAPGGAGEP
jgi:tetratricopeptide (TPR) repeat protein